MATIPQNVFAGASDEALEFIQKLQTENETLRGLAEWIKYHYANQDMNHQDFRVQAYSLAMGATHEKLLSSALAWVTPPTSDSDPSNGDRQ